MRMNVALAVLLSAALISAGASGAILKLEWTFDQGNVADTGGQGINGSLFGSPWFTVDRNGGLALTGDGNDSAYKTGIGTSLLPLAGTDTWSINAWVKPDDAPSDWNVLFAIGAKPGGSATSRAVYTNGSGNIVFTGGGGEGDRFLVSEATFDVGVWQMITATYDGTEVRLYKNGGLIGSEAMTFTNALGEVRIPTNPGWGTMMSGAFDDFTIWSGALTQSEISAMVPEPATLTLLGIGMLSLVRRRR